MATKQLTAEQKRAKKRKYLIRRVVFCAVCLAVVVLVVALLVAGIRAIKKGNQQSAKPADFSQIGPTQPASATDLAGYAVLYDYAAPVPESAEVSDAYFIDALFVGDSRTQGLSLYNVIPNATILASTNVNVSGVLEYKFDVGETSMTLLEALASKPYTSVYLSLGVNELGWNSVDDFIAYYGDLIESIKAAQPLTQIYIQSLLPVSANRDASSEIYTNARVNEYNAKLQSLASSKQVYYLDVASAYRDGSGVLPADSTSDGINLNSDAFGPWYTYLKTHTVLKENYKN